jgi:hypothetical protein
VQNVVRKVCTYLPDCTEPHPKKTMIPVLNFPLITNNEIQRNWRPNLSAIPRHSRGETEKKEDDEKPRSQQAVFQAIRKR